MADNSLDFGGLYGDGKGMVGTPSIDPRSQSQIANLLEDKDAAESVSLLTEYYAKSGRSQSKVRLEWKNLTYKVVLKDAITKKYKEKTILNNVSGSAESGQLLAIMGPTGCGKTSLMNILAAKLPKGGYEYQSLSGEILVNGQPRDDEKFRRVSSYVLQDDFMYAHLTVLEILTLASHFYCPATMTEEEKSELVHAVIMELGLVKAKDTLIGNDKVRGVSGGERKRANIGIQLITNPAVLFLDEPTSGLDSFQALAVMECIKGLASRGRLVVSIIHQPRSQIYSMFDHMLLLSSGKDTFFGKAADALSYFQSQGFSCPEEFNPADYYLDILSPDNRTKELEAESANRITDISDKWSNSAFKTAHVTAQLTADSKLESNVQEHIAEIGLDSSCASFAVQLKYLSWRTWTEVRRDWITTLVGTIISSIFGLIVGGVYSNTGLAQIDIQNRNGCLFFIGVNSTMTGLFAVLNSFPKEKNIVNTERANRAYEITPYFLGKLIVETPIRLIPTFAYGCILYFLVGLNPHRFGEFLGIAISVTFTAMCFGLMISAVMPTLEAANAVGPLLVVIMIMFGGFYIDIASLPKVADLVPYISILRWAFQSFAINEYRGLVFECEPGKMCLKTGEQVLTSLGFGDKTLNYPLGGLYINCAVFAFLAYVALLRSKAEYSPLNFTGKHFTSITKALAEANHTELSSENKFRFWSRVSKDAKESSVELTPVATQDPDK